MLVTVHRRERQRAADEMRVRSLEQELARQQQCMAQYCASLREELGAEKLRVANGNYTQSEEEEAMCRVQRIKQLCADIYDFLHESDSAE